MDRDNIATEILMVTIELHKLNLVLLLLLLLLLLIIII